VLRKQRSPKLTVSSLEVDDGDALIMGLSPSAAHRLAIISHGLEGSMNSSYVTGMSHALMKAGWDVLTWNMRGCGGQPNKLPTWYHSGKSDDLGAIVKYALSLPYQEIALVGFSVGGNITLKYLGEMGDRLPSQIRKAVVFSVPMDLRGSAEQLARPCNRLYMEYLLRPLRARIREKAQQYPTLFSIKGLDTIKTFREFDERYTAPMHGFRSVDEYWDTSSSIHYLTRISAPTLAISAQDDPFLSPSCFPVEALKDLPHVFFEIPRHGGHVGFLDAYSLTRTWAEKRAVEFLAHL
jgi:predicted alpha/beta-fold hydrolase